MQHLHLSDTSSSYAALPPVEDFHLILTYAAPPPVRHFHLILTYATPPPVRHFHLILTYATPPPVQHFHLILTYATPPPVRHFHLILTYATPPPVRHFHLILTYATPPPVRHFHLILTYATPPPVRHFHLILTYATPPPVRHLHLILTYAIPPPVRHFHLILTYAAPPPVRHFHLILTLDYKHLHLSEHFHLTKLTYATPPPVRTNLSTYYSHPAGNTSTCHDTSTSYTHLCNTSTLSQTLPPIDLCNTSTCPNTFHLIYYLLCNYLHLSDTRSTSYSLRQCKPPPVRHLHLILQPHYGIQHLTPVQHFHLYTHSNAAPPPVRHFHPHTHSMQHLHLFTDTFQILTYAAIAPPTCPNTSKPHTHLMQHSHSVQHLPPHISPMANTCSTCPTLPPHTHLCNTSTCPTLPPHTHLCSTSTCPTLPPHTHLCNTSTCLDHFTTLSDTTPPHTHLCNTSPPVRHFHLITHAYATHQTHLSERKHFHLILRPMQNTSTCPTTFHLILTYADRPPPSVRQLPPHTQPMQDLPPAPTWADTSKQRRPYSHLPYVTSQQHLHLFRTLPHFPPHTHTMHISCHTHTHL
ncbi:hypothetical protein NFI96_009208 [Prochilodus magdalenae]|nr:hypothetical protein NFI96_009208 [Prochilodus magdalenae]